VVVGPEAPLVAGLADALEGKTKVFGPTAAGARLEGSKSFAKQLMAEKGIPTASARSFSDPVAAISYVHELGGRVAVKADGLAAGKGVTVCDDPAEAEAAIREAMIDGRFGEAGATVLVEERLHGPELSILAFCSGKTVLVMQAAQDFKPVSEGNKGPNTGGMGSYSPVPIASEKIRRQAVEEILEPIAAAVEERSGGYVGVIYAGLMLTAQGLKVIEFNCRFGDPETQALLPRLESDLAEVMMAAVDGDLAGAKLRWSEHSCVCVVAASKGYPQDPDMRTGLAISGLDTAAELKDVVVFHSGTGFSPQSPDTVVTAGGRVLSVSGLGPGVEEARNNAYRALNMISFEGMHYRKDIAAGVASGTDVASKTGEPIE
ncbi:MAG: phosphoribosylamine--glycine ligase, partial [Actinomycetota bacterium]